MRRAQSSQLFDLIRPAVMALALLLTAPSSVAQTAADCVPLGDAEFCAEDTVWQGEIQQNAPDALYTDAGGMALRLSAGPLNLPEVHTPRFANISRLTTLSRMAQDQGAEITAHWEAGDAAFGWPTLAVAQPDANIVALISLYPAPERDYLVTTLRYGSIVSRPQFAAHREALAALRIPSADPARDLVAPSLAFEPPSRPGSDCAPLGGVWLCPTHSTLWPHPRLTPDMAEGVEVVQSAERLASVSLLTGGEFASMPVDQVFALVLDNAESSETVAQFLSDSPYAGPSLEYLSQAGANQVQLANIITVFGIGSDLFLITTTRRSATLTEADRAAHREAIAMLRSTR